MIQPQNAVIYIRTACAPSSRCDAKIEKQENRCRDYADKHDIKVEAVFRGSRESGRTAVRPGLSALIGYIRKNETSIHRSDERTQNSAR